MRVGKGPRTRIKADYGTPEFEAAYQTAIAGTPGPMPRANKPCAGTIAWAINLYRGSKAWNALAPATRRQRDNIFKGVTETTYALEPLRDVTPVDIKKGCKRRESRPSSARHFLMTMRGLFQWALDEDLVVADPTAGLSIKAAKTDGHPMWTDVDIEAYERRWPIGTRERVAFDILLYTGLRRGDAVALGRPHVKDGVIRLKTEKTGEWVAIVICSELAQTLAAGPCGDLTYIAGEKGRPRVKESFGEWFRVACHAAGVQKSAHGLRKAAATRAANNRASESELEAMFGWRGGRMASHYTRQANREALAIGAADKLSRRKEPGYR
jgi:integrase